MRVDRGTRVVVEPEAGSFFEAQVTQATLSPLGGELKVQRASGESLTLPAADVYPLAVAPGAEQDATGAPLPPLPSGSLLICRTAGGWVGCRVTVTAPGGLTVELLEGHAATFGAKDVILPTALTRLNLERRFRALDAQRRFHAAAKAAGHPKRRPGYTPAHRERVVARRGDEWHTAHVTRFFDDGSYRVSWGDGARESDVRPDHVVPEPPYRVKLRRGSFALRKPVVPSLPWRAVRVVTARDEILVEDARGEHSVATLHELIPLQEEEEIEAAPE
ncbi:MAG: hypothetical protein KIT72_13645 [Polyangiaceae bacterium]|nr:hypothetical protein [Polyangiaceae bacterium]MCW5791455.1 hypothetical protein [Polyangiaceae bacterium]